MWERRGSGPKRTRARSCTATAGDGYSSEPAGSGPNTELMPFPGVKRSFSNERLRFGLAI